MISAGKASLLELDTHYGVADLWMLLEIITVDNHNRAILNKPKG